LPCLNTLFAFRLFVIDWAGFVSLMPCSTSSLLASAVGNVWSPCAIAAYCPATRIWAEFVPFLAFDTEIRRVICSTNAIESVNARIRRAVKARGHFPTEQAALKCVYMAVMSLDPTGTGRKRWIMRWKPALNAFEIAFDGRLAAGRK
jgi:transposase-like protein